ncbi:MAG TPA: protein translocase subunit SecD [Acidimicrobiales bacterium]|nr:protein translocase subunit SecD [Acidimicrobiales bacterium]
MAVLVLLTIGMLVGVFAAGWGPKLGLDLEGGFAVTLQPVDKASEDLLDQSIEVIRSRVDALGVAEPEITRQGETIEVSLPGVTDRERARELVGQTAELRFRPVLASIPGSVDDLVPSTTTTAAGETTTTVAGLTPTTAVGETTTTAAEGVSGQAASGPAVPFQDGGTTTIAEATTTTVAGDTTTTTAAPGATGFELTPREQDLPDQPVVLAETDDNGKVVSTYQLGPSVATGKIVSGAQASLDQTGQWIVRLDIKGSQIDAFNANAAAPCYSRQATCPQGALAIVLDSRVVMAPNIQQPSYKADQISISGSLSEAEAKDLALVLRYGSLPVALEIQQTREVSATLGSDSMRAGIVSGLVGLALVAIYMLAVYRLMGLVAIGSLSVSAGLLWVIIAWMGETRGLALTLAGITGIIVSIGVAVDSNVVFYEHLKEEVWRGRTARSAATTSFSSAFSTIVTANMASFIGAALLYILTVGSVRGFALFLAIGTLLDMLASYYVMRPLVLWLVKSKRFADRPRLLGVSTTGGPQS